MHPPFSLHASEKRIAPVKRSQDVRITRVCADPQTEAFIGASVVGKNSDGYWIKLAGDGQCSLMEAVVDGTLNDTPQSSPFSSELQHLTKTAGFDVANVPP
jgi:hypothetical protein